MVSIEPIPSEEEFSPRYSPKFSDDEVDIQPTLNQGHIYPIPQNIQPALNYSQIYPFSQDNQTVLNYGQICPFPQVNQPTLNYGQMYPIPQIQNAPAEHMFAMAPSLQKYHRIPSTDQK